MSHQTDYQSITQGEWDVEDYDGSRPGNVEGYCIPLLISESEATTLLASFDSTDASSPSETVSREIARAVLLALKQFKS